MLILAVSLLSITTCANASDQNQMGGDRPPRFEKISESDFYSGLNLGSSVKAKLQVILDDFKTTLDNKFKNSKTPPAREDMDPLIEARDSKVKPLLTDSQYETYKKTVEGLFVPDENQRPKMQ
jgi:hypothetical protein